MSVEPEAGSYVGSDHAPGESAGAAPSLGAEVRAYLLGLGLAAVLTAASFWVTGTTLIYGPGLPMTLTALAVAQMGIHLVFFLHITTAPDNTNNVLALAFGFLIVCMLVFGTLWVMYHLDRNMIPVQELMRMQR